MTEQPNTPASTPDGLDDRILIALPAEAAEVLARILFQFDTHVDPAALDFEFDHNLWHHTAIDLLKAKALLSAARNGIQTAVAHRADLFVDVAGKTLVAEAERHLRTVSDQ